MYPVQSPSPSPNSIFGDSVLSSKYFDPAYLFNRGYESLRQLFTYLSTDDFRSFFMTLLFFLSAFFITLISYCVVRLFEIRRKEHHHLEQEIAEYAHHQAEREKKLKEGEGGSKNERWMQTLAYLFSENPNDWKLAIIEADSMLESLLDQVGFKGASLGDKLKAATEANFRGINYAWEVHTIRNRIAHEGSAFALSQHEAKRVIALYEQIFREFGFI